MAGHRKARGRPTQAQARRQRMTTRLAAAASPQARAAAAFDWLRIETANMPPDDAAPLLLDAARHLERLALDAGRSHAQ